MPFLLGRAKWGISRLLSEGGWFDGGSKRKAQEKLRDELLEKKAAAIRAAGERATEEAKKGQKNAEETATMVTEGMESAEKKWDADSGRLLAEVQRKLGGGAGG